MHKNVSLTGQQPLTFRVFNITQATKIQPVPQIVMLFLAKHPLGFGTFFWEKITKHKIFTTIPYYACSAAYCAVPTDTSFCVLLALEPDQKSPKSKRNPLAESTKICDPLSKGISFEFQRFCARLQSKQTTKSCVGRNHTLCYRASTIGNCHPN